MPQKEKNKFSLKSRAKSFRHALNGIRRIIREEHNARVHLVATFLAIVGGWMLQLNTTEWFWVGLSIAIVWITELLNSALEKLADAITLEHNEYIQKAKDYAAGAVLIAAIFSLVVAVLVLYSRLF